MTLCQVKLSKLAEPLHACPQASISPHNTPKALGASVKTISLLTPVTKQLLHT